MIVTILHKEEYLSRNGEKEQLQIFAWRIVIKGIRKEVCKFKVTKFKTKKKECAKH